ncbi:PREDICTED: cell division cycle-associated protein 2 [Merops nubicus]|uniref:cell division cycle-associated protein 2 n=1 Tax=Merops nubicus TaxID=57421 RepID=UPI0004F07F4A|nr:PREDICTED: cell division cycle-associated protein 2 [Merops nubicus]
MHRRSDINAALEVKDNESKYMEVKEEASFPHPPKEKICKVTKSRTIRASKENLRDGNEAQLQKSPLKCPQGLEEESYRDKEGVESCQFTECPLDRLKGDVAGECLLPLNSKENVPIPVSLWDECYCTPDRDKAEEKSDCGIPEKQRKTPADFATVTITEFGMSQESFTKHSLGQSPASLKLRRRSAIGVRGSPENNALIKFLAQQRSSRQKAAFTQASPFKYDHLRSLKNKIDAFQTSFKAVQEAEGETGFPGPSQGDHASQEAGSSQNKVSLTKEWNVDQGSEKFMVDNSGADWKENLRPSLSSCRESGTKICPIVSACQDVTVTEPAAAAAGAKEWVNEQHNPIESSEAVLIRDILETEHGFTSDPITKDFRRDVLSALSRKKAGFVEELSLEMFYGSKPPTTPPATPLRTGSASINEQAQSGSRLRSVLKKTPVKAPVDGTEGCWNDAVGRGGVESFSVSSCAEISEALQTVEKTKCPSSERPKKKRVTFGEVLSPEIFDEALPANTPLRRGAAPAPQPPAQSNSPAAGPGPGGEPLPQPDFDCTEECDESLQELVEGPVAAEALLPVENAEAETDKSDMIKTRSSTKRKPSAVSEGADSSTSRATSTKNAKDTKNPRKNKLQRQKSVTASAAKKTQRVKHTNYGKRRRKKVNKSLYGEREMASKKPLLSPIAEIPEDFFSVSSPNSPKANALFSEDVFLASTQFGDDCKDVQQKAVVESMRETNIQEVDVHGSSKDLGAAGASSSHDTVIQVSDGADVEPASGLDQKFSNIVPDVKCGFDTAEYFQEGKEPACVKEAEESGSLIESEKLEGNLLNKVEQLTGLEFVEQQDSSLHEGVQSTWCPQKDSVGGSSSRRRGRRSSAIFFPPVEKLETTVNSPLVSFNIDEVLSVPQLKTDSLRPFKRKSDNSGEKRVRRSMRLHRDSGMEGLAWVQVPNETEKTPPQPASARKTRRTIGTSILLESEIIHHKEQDLILSSAPGKENNDSVHLAGNPCRRGRRKSLCVPTPQETRTSSQISRRRSTTNSVYRRHRSHQNHYEDVERPLENHSNI